MYLNIRKRTILETILNKQVDLDDLATIMNVSTRTIRRDLLYIENILLENNFYLKKSKYYYIEGDLKILKEFLRTNSFVEYTITERHICIVANIIRSNDVSVSTLAFDLFTIEKVIYEDIEFINSIFSSKLIDINNGFISFGCSEDMIRNLIFKLLKDSLTIENVCEIAIDLKFDKTLYKNIKTEINQLIDTSLFTEVGYIVEESFTDKKRYVNDMQLIEMTLFILVSLKRMSSNSFLKKEFEKSVTNSTIEYDIVERLAIENEYEASFIIKFLSNYTIDIEMKNVAVDVNNKIIEFLKYINQNLNIDYINKSEVQINVYNHIIRNIENNKPSINIDDHPFVDLVADYDFIYQIIKLANEHAMMDFTSSELAEILIYYVLQLEQDIVKINWKIVVICMGGMGTSLMIKNSIQQIFSNAIIDNIALSSLNKLTNDSYDVIITTTSFSHLLPAIVVSPIISSQDIRNLKLHFIKLRLKNEQIVHVNKFDVRNNIIFSNSVVREHSKNEALKSLLHELESNDIIVNPDELLEKLLKRERYGIAIPSEQIGFYHIMEKSIKVPVIHIAPTTSYQVLGIDMILQDCSYVLVVLIPDLNTNPYQKRLSEFSRALIEDKFLTKAIKANDIGYLESKFKI